jgi:SSS family solute:Na+ symporter
LTIPLSIALNLAFPQMPFFNRTGVVFWTCVVVSVIVSLVTKPKPEEELKGLMWNKSVLRVPENERKFNRGFRNTGMWWAIITVLVLYFYIRYA